LGVEGFGCDFCGFVSMGGWYFEGGLRGESWSGESAALKYKISTLGFAFPPPNPPLPSSNFLISPHTFSTSLISARSPAFTNTHSDPGAVSCPNAMTSSARSCRRPTRYTRNFAPCFANVVAKARATYEPMPVVPPTRTTTRGGPEGRRAMFARMEVRFGIVVLRIADRLWRAR